MSQYNSRKDSETGRSRAKSSASASRSSSRLNNSRRRSSKSNNYRGTYGSGNRGVSGRRSSKKRRNNRNDYSKIALGGVILIAAVTLIIFLLKGMGKQETPIEETETTVPETELQKEVFVDDINITGMSRTEAKTAILKKYPWAMTVVWEEQVYEVANLMEEQVDALLEEIYSGEPEERYALDMSGMEDAVKAEAEHAAAKWNKKAKNGSISSYDLAADRFIFSGAETGLKLDEDKLAADILAALNTKKFDATVTAAVNTVQPEYSEDAARERYEKLSTFTTKTTANKNRNENIKLAAQALNGTIVYPGQEFSFNETVGERTEKKGYKGAAAYNNGDVVQEIGGGVCQVSSTLYNAVVKAGLKTTFRRSHTYEPSYVTPGTDATVSWGGPDYKFQNTSEAGIGIRARYADQTLTISIYGIPVLEDGVTYSLESSKLNDTDPPAPTYEEDPTLEPGVEKVKSKGSIGSKWETRLVVKKNGEVISKEIDHTVTYKGHAPVILRNTSGTVAETTAAETASSESSIAPEGAADGFGTSASGSESEQESASSSASGPASANRETTAANRETAAANATAAPTKAPEGTTAAPVPKPTSASQPETTVEAPGTTSVKPTVAERENNAPTAGNAPTAADDIPMIAPKPGA